MTNITASEIKYIYFGILFMACIGIFTYFYNQEPIITNYKYDTSAANASSASSEDSWIGSIIGVLPAPFDDPTLLLLSGVIIIPITIMLGYVSIRAIKDLISQWI